ncbi:hypothetical protein [Steroidobacter sp.]|uniref:hypothetical protein n=1 Tax=Steroidobacter sp. TaxID=1978227 RepID=UPI001A45A620|nr:hypothetical protein [Steroidobacter sp.]MBL8264754.1 hypothetical protein [Steroidobacter sp.]
MKSAAATDAWLETPFVRQSVTPTATPEGCEGNWFKYVISQGDNEITGLRAGSLNEVTRQVDEMTDRLNERRIGKQKYK